jgi:hypothetical protein
VCCAERTVKYFSIYVLIFCNCRNEKFITAMLLKHTIDGNLLSPREEEIIAQGANWEHDEGL